MRIVSQQDLDKVVKQMQGADFGEQDVLYSEDKGVVWLKAYGRPPMKKNKVYFLALNNVLKVMVSLDKATRSSEAQPVLFDWVDSAKNTFAFFGKNFKVEISVRKIEADFEILASEV